MRSFAVAGLAICVLFVQSEPLSAFGHKKLEQRLQELRQPAPTKAEPAPLAPTQPVVKPTPSAQPAPVRRPPAKRSITNIAGDVYQFKNNFHNSVFLVTPHGVIFVDPINRGASTWLKAELWRRFNQPVKYVIYSHDHADHISGGEIFADTAIFVSHVKAKRDIIEESRPTPVPDITFKEQMTLELGGRTVELTFVGRNHSDNSIVVGFPAERVLHVVDFVSVRTIAFRDLPATYLDDWIESMKRVEAMDFDILSTGHGRSGGKADVRAFRGYVEELRAEVTKLARAGKSADEVVAMVTMDKYRSWGAYNMFIKANVRAMYNLVQLNRRGNPRPRR